MAAVMPLSAAANHRHPSAVELTAEFRGRGGTKVPKDPLILAITPETPTSGRVCLYWRKKWATGIWPHPTATEHPNPQLNAPNRTRLRPDAPFLSDLALAPRGFAEKLPGTGRVL